MSDGGTAAADASPFSLRAAVVLVGLGAVIFVVLLWMVGAGMMSGPANDGGSHAGARGLNGYAAFAEYMEGRAWTTARTRRKSALEEPGLLVLTPPHDAEGEEIERIVAARRATGPTLIVVPKWIAAPYPRGVPGARPGWVQLVGTRPPHWPGFLDDVTVEIEPMRPGGRKAQWMGGDLHGELPVAKSVLSGIGERLVPLVIGRQDGRILAAFVSDGGIYPALEDMAVEEAGRPGDDDSLYPIVLVFEPDLLNNYGFAEPANARLAEELVSAAAEDAGGVVNFDLTLNGHGRSANLLTLAFTPPFLAATLCLLLAASAVAWRAFLRFGPPHKPERAIAFGKSALVANAAALIRRTRRLHLIAVPYIERTRDRILRALRLPHQANMGAADAAIDRELEKRAADAAPFSETAARLRSARSRHELVKAARALHEIERTLLR